MFSIALTSCVCVSVHACSHVYAGSLNVLARAFCYFRMCALPQSAAACIVLTEDHADENEVLSGSPPMMIHLQKGTSWSVPMKAMPRYAFRDLRCFSSDIDYEAFHVWHSVLSVNSGFYVICFSDEIRRHRYFHCLGCFLPLYFMRCIR